MPHPNVELWYEPEDVMESPLRLTAHGGFGGGGEPDAYAAYANSPILQKGQQRYLAGRLLHYGRVNFDLLRKRVLHAA
jgi:hypothetical protein